MVFTANAYSTFQVVEFRNKQHQIAELQLYERCTWDGTETFQMFPSTLAFSRDVGGRLEGKSVRIKSATVNFITLAAGTAKVYLSLGTILSAWNHLFPTVIAATGEVIDLESNDTRHDFRWDQANATNTFLSLGASTAPAAGTVSDLNVWLEVVE